MILESIPEVARLSPAEKLILVGELWDDLAAHPAEIPLSREQIEELDRRMKAYREDPSHVTTWEAVQMRILGKCLDGGMRREAAEGRREDFESFLAAVPDREPEETDKVP